MSLISNNIQYPEAVTAYINNNGSCPTLDDWLHNYLSDDEKSLYTILMKMRYTAGQENFPVDFDLLWKELTYNRKDYAKDALTTHYSIDVEYILVRFKPERFDGNDVNGGQNREDFFLTVDAAQKFAMRARTKIGDTVSDFFIKILKCIQEYHLLSLLYSKKQDILLTMKHHENNTSSCDIAYKSKNQN